MTNSMIAQWCAGKKSIVITRGDGATMLVPADPANADYAALLGARTPIADYVAPPAPVPAISPFQASLWLAQHGKSDADVLTVIGAITDATARLSALAYWNKASAPFRTVTRDVDSGDSNHQIKCRGKQLVGVL